MSDDLFGPVPLGAPESMLRYGQPTLFDVVHAVNQNGRLGRENQAAIAAQLLRTAAKSPDLRWGTLLGGGIGAGAGLLGAKHLTNLNEHSQYGVAGAAGIIGALIGRAIQRVKKQEVP